MRRVFLFFLLLLLSLSLILVPAAAQTLIPTLPFPPSSTPVPTLTQVPSSTPRGCFASLGFSPGVQVVLIPGVNVRHLPSLSGAVVNYYTESTLLRVTDGPVCENGYNWWRVEGVGNPGWVIEGRPGRYYLSEAALTPDPSTICSPPLAMTTGARTRTLTGVRVHADAGLGSLVLTVVPLNTSIEVLDGPVCLNRINWWRVRVPFDDISVEGWVGEGYPENYWLESNAFAATATAYCPRPLRLAPGTKVGITYDDAVARSLRAAPSRSAALVERLIGGVALELLGEPVCADGFNWWQARVLSTDITGWVAEGRPGNYWFDIIYQQPTPTPLDWD